MPVLPREQWPVEHACLLGIFTGGCVERGDGSRFRAKAHAHTSGAFKGWLCVLSAKRLCVQPLMLHELAHLIAESGHTDKWRAALLAIGGTLDAVGDILKDYHKRSRPRGRRSRRA